MVGKSLQHYQVAELIGKGGMGEVYRAHDTKLGRDVALKILPPEFAADGDRLARFQREAKVLASLHHPNIASIFGFESTPQCTFLVMEMVEGQDLAEILQRGPLPVDEAVDIARQIAEGLEEAHEKGIIHRDLKPANVKRTGEGKVKVLDFGLARAYAGHTAAEQEVSSAPTMTAPMTQVGSVLGTAAYMSPEQARGKEVDRRADIWAFGVILFEMLTGKRLFQGETASDTLAGILKSEPDWESLPADLPFQVGRVLRRCLAKEPRQRLRDIGEARVRLDDPTAESGMFSGQISAVTGTGRGWSGLLPWGLFVAACAVVLWLGLFRAPGPEPAAPIHYRFGLELPAAAGFPALSPDGRRFAYVSPLEGRDVIWVRSFAEEEGQPLKGSEPTGSGLFWSPDGQSLGYFSGDNLEVARVEGGSAQPVCQLPGGWRTADWSATGEILVEISANPEDSGWYLCRPGQPAEKIERPVALESGQSRAQPRFLPDGRHYVFAQHVGGVRQAILGRLGAGEHTLMFPTDTGVLVSDDGWYLFSRKGQLLAQAFDPGSYLPVGEARVLADEVALFTPNGRLSAKASDQGTVLYSVYREDGEVAWFDRQGRKLGPVVSKGDYREASLSPDGRLLAITVNDPRTGTGDLWVEDLERGLRTRLTSTSWAEFSPIWSPDGRQLTYSADPEGPPNIFTVGIDGGEPFTVVPMNQHVHYPTSWTSQGDQIIYMRTNPETSADIWAVAAGGGEPRLLVSSDRGDFSGAVSPDGRWLAYVSNITDRNEIYLRPLDGSSPAQRVSIDGGRWPTWEGNQRLWFRAPEEQLMAVDLDLSAGRLVIGHPEIAFTLEEGQMESYGLHPDGRILVAFRQGRLDVEEYKVLVGW